MSVSRLGSTSVSIPEHPLKARPPIHVTVSGTVSVVMLVQFWKAQGPIPVVAPSGINGNAVRDVQFPNAL